VKPKWFLETDAFHENLGLLVEEIRRQGMEAKIASYLGDNASHLDLFDKDDCVIYYGSLNFAAQVKREAPWVPGVYYNKPAYECQRYYPALAKYDLLNANYMMLPYGDLIRLREFIIDKVGEQGCVFIRPSTGSKLFTGKVVCNEDWEKDVNYLGFYGAEPHELCVVAPPCNVEAEWRFVAVEGKIVAGSQYRAANKTDVKAGYCPEAHRLASRVAASGYDPDPVWCIDICRTRMGNYYLLEIGCFSCAGLYECDKEVVVREVSRVALKEWEDLR